MKVQEEARMQIFCANYLKSRGLLFTSICNETPAGRQINGRWTPNYSSIRKEKAMGKNKGHPDLRIILGKNKEIDLSVELKAPSKLPKTKKSKGGVSDEQKQWIDAINNSKKSVAKVIYSSEDFVNLIEDLEKEVIK